jgi:hypothetical protein
MLDGGDILSQPSQKETSRHTRRRAAPAVAVGTAALVLIGAGAFVYNSFVLPARDLNAFGVDEIRPWSARTALSWNWFGGSAATYAYPVGPDVETRLRARCSPLASTAQCVFGERRESGARLVSASVGRGIVVLSYDSET